jgi:multidrug efflux pump subunit AcrA (membrane-fusion protein)
MNDKNTSKWTPLKITAVVFSLLLITLIFLSKTIYTYNLPQVTGVLPFRGKLNKIEYARGVVAYGAVAELYADYNCKIEAVLAREGDLVEKGDVIFEVSFSGADEEVKKQMAALEEEGGKRASEQNIAMQRLELDIERINAGVLNTNRKIEELKGETYKVSDVSGADIVKCERDIDRAEEDLEELKTLYEAGVIARGDVDNAERNLSDLRERLDGLKKANEDSLAKNVEALADMEKNRQKQIMDLEYQLTAYEQELAAKRLDLAANALQEQTYEESFTNKMKEYAEKLQTYDVNRVILAPESGIITGLYQNKGQLVSTGLRLASFGLTDTYVVECEIPADNDFVEAEDTYKVRSAGGSVRGTVIKVVPSDMGKTVTLGLAEGAEVTAGLTVEVVFEKQSGETYMLIPSGALGQDSEGYFLNQIKRRDGILGKEYYAEKLRVYIGGSDAVNTALTRGVTFAEPMVLISDKPFSEGETIKVRNAGDFFAD